MENEIYVVQEGDTIVSVAQLYGIRIMDLIKANNLEDVYYLTPGEELIIPTDSPLGFTYYIVQKGDTIFMGIMSNRKVSTTFNTYFFLIIF